MNIPAKRATLLSALALPLFVLATAAYKTDPAPAPTQPVLGTRSAKILDVKA